jgi:hypothetical protein
MSFVLVAPDLLETAVTDAAEIGSALRTAHLSAVSGTTVLEAAGADEVSAAITALFGAHAQEYQAAAARVATRYNQFVRTLGAAVASYAGAEEAIATSMRQALSPLPANPANSAATGFQTFVHGPIETIGEAWISSPFGRSLDPIINASARLLLGHDLIGIGVGGQTGTGGQTPAGGGGAAKSIVIDLIRHGQSEANVADIITSAVPGPPLTALGIAQATAIGNTLAGQGPFGGIFASQMLRTQMTAAPLATLLGVANVPQLAGLNEISVGNFEGAPTISVQSFLRAAGPIAWWLGLPIVPLLAPGANLNGVTFYQGFNSALETMYSSTVNISPGPITDVAFSSQFTMQLGTQMTVRNPDPLLMITHQLPNVGEVVIQGNPQDGWTLVSWDGVSVQPHSLPLLLVGTTRDLVMAPQFALDSILRSFGTGDPRAITSAIGTGVGDVVTATLNYPIGVVWDVVEALSALPPL